MFIIVHHSLNIPLYSGTGFLKIMIQHLVYSGEPRGPGCMTVHALEFDWFVEDCNDEFDFVCERTLNECKYALTCFVLF